MLKMSSRHSLCVTIATVACHVFASRVVALPSLPEGELPNSEVVTNVVLDVNLDRLALISFSLALDASESNRLSIAVGVASGEELMLEEVDFEWGYDCGKWFYADTATGGVEEWPSVETGRVERTLAIDNRHFNPQWNRIRIAKRGLGELNVEAVQTNEFKKFSIRLR